MKKNTKFFLIAIFLQSLLLFGQSDIFPLKCEIDYTKADMLNKVQMVTPNCGNTSGYGFQNWHSNDLYIPSQNDSVIYVKINFIFLTKPDGTGNFEQNNPEHIKFLDNMINLFNHRMGNLGQPILGCESSIPQVLSDTKIRVIVKKIWKVDPAWDFLITGFNPSNNSAYDNNGVLMPGPNYYYSYLDNDPSIPNGINITFTNNGTLYNDYLNGVNISVPPINWAAAEFPNSYSLNSKLRQFWPDIYNGYLFRKNNVVGNATFGNPSWEIVKTWYYSDLGARAMVHELGHNLGLQHHDCGSNIMSYSAGNHDYLSMQDISLMHQNASISNARQYFTVNSFKNTSLNVNSNELWDVNFRIYSNVKIDNNSSLRATCKIIMPDESRIVAKSGSNFIIEGADLSPANNVKWNGIKVEGTG